MNRCLYFEIGRQEKSKLLDVLYRKVECSSRRFYLLPAGCLGMKEVAPFYLKVKWQLSILKSPDTWKGFGSPCALPFKNTSHPAIHGDPYEDCFPLFFRNALKNSKLLICDHHFINSEHSLESL
jgi:hypothetical protein